MKKKKIFLFSIALIISILLINSFFIIKESKSALTILLGNIRRTNISPGIHLKIPFIEKIVIFDNKIQNLQINMLRTMTSEQKYVFIKYYVKWKIIDNSIFFKKIINYKRANILLKHKVNSLLREEIAKNNLLNLISNTYNDVLNKIIKKSNINSYNIGIKVLDIQIQEINLPQEVKKSVFDRMSAQREQVATQLRSEGKAIAECNKSMIEKKVKIMLASAKKQASQIRAEGNKHSMDIYIKYFNINKNFYKFYQSLQSYKKVFNKNDLIFLDSKNHFLKNFN